jgi:hypothetical protein
VRVILGFHLYIGDESGLVWASGLGLIYRGGCIRMPASVNDLRGGCIIMPASVNAY